MVSACIRRKSLICIRTNRDDTTEMVMIAPKPNSSLGVGDWMGFNAVQP
jgi:hypothetical protein